MRHQESSGLVRSVGRISRLKLFISYSHRNRVWMERLRVFLDGFQYDDRCGTWAIDCPHMWHDNELTKGNAWDAEIQRELREMDIFIPLVSPEFFSSWYIQNVELPCARERHAQGEILVIPIVLYQVNLRDKCEFLHRFPSLPTSDRCWSRYRDRNNAYQLIDDGLWHTLSEAMRRKYAR